MQEFGFGSLIDEFVSVGPKNYAFVVFSPAKRKCISKCKVKGITVNYNNLEVVNFTSLRNMILIDDTPTHVHNPKKMKKNNGGIDVSEPE